jgi:hypothetical protein
MKNPPSPALQNLDALQSLMMTRMQLNGNEWQAAVNSFEVIREALTKPAAQVPEPTPNAG